MVFSAQACMLLLTICVLIMYIKDKHIHTISNSVFTHIVVWTTILMLCNFVVLLLMNTNLVAYVQMHSWLHYVVMFIDKIKISCAVAVVFNVFSYSLLNIFPHVFSYFGIKKYLQFIIAAIPIFLPADIDFNYHQVYGSYYYFFFGLALVCVVFFVFFSVKNFHILDKIRFKCTLVWISVFVLGEIYNIFMHQTYIAIFSCNVGLLLFFYYVENPKSHIDSSTGFFNIYFLKEYIEFYLSWNRPLYVGIIYSRFRHFDVDMLNALSDDSVEYFKDMDSCVYITCENKNHLVDILESYKKTEEVVVLLYMSSVDTPLDLVTAYVKRYAESLSRKTLHFLSNADIRKLDDDEKVRMEIVHALVEDRIVTYIQPIYDLKKGEFTSGECLCRLRRSNGEIMSPAQFIPVAEQTGLITSIESVMFNNLCKCLADDRIKASHIQYLDVNLSIKKGECHSLVEEYVAVLNQYGVDADRINLEITETDIVEEKMSILNNMESMKSYGFRFSLDDFGVGESNLGYIIDMPVSTIKFDKDLTNKAIIDNKAKLVLKGVVQMAHSLDIKVVIEGIEDESGVNFCRDLDADYIQGYYFSKPLPVEDFIDMLT